MNFLIPSRLTFGIPPSFTSSLQVQQRRAAECDEQRGDRVDSGRSHENVHRDAHQQSERQQQQRRDLHRQQDDKGDVGQRMNVDADPDPAEQENLQQGHYHE